MKTPIQFIIEKYDFDADNYFELEVGQWLICMREYANYVLNYKV